MKKYVKRGILTCSSFELQCNEYYNILQGYHIACKDHNEHYFMQLLVELGRFQGQLICFKVDNLFSSEEVEFLYNKSKLLVRRIESRISRELLKMKLALRLKK